MGIVRDRLTKAWGQIPQVLQLASAVSAFVVFVVPSLGYLALRHRALLLQLPEGVLTYPTEELALTGVALLWRLPWRMLAALFDVAAPTWIPSLLVLALCIAVQLGRKRRATFQLIVSAALCAGLILAALAYRELVVFDAIGAGARKIADDPLTQARLETFQWLREGTKAAAARREALAGFGGWLLLLAGLVLARLWRLDPPRRAFPGFVRRAALWGAGVTALFLAGQIPRAHAYAQWGQSCPTVRGVVPGCAPGLQGIDLEHGPPRAWDVSVGARQEYILTLRGEQRVLVPLRLASEGRCALLGSTQVVPDLNFTP
jgi:hypothetical protein